MDGNLGRSVREQVAEKSIWASGRGSDKRMEKTA
jgi:hypothetical protein